MRKWIKLSPLLLTGLFILFLVTNSLPVHAADDIQRVYDNAGLLMDDEIKDLEQQAETYSAKRDINYLIVTTDNPAESLLSGNYSSTEARTEAYSEAFYDSFVETYGKEESDCTIMTIDMSNSYVDFSGQGDAEEKLDDGRCSQLYKKVVPYLTDKDYYSACSKYIKTANQYVGVKIGIDPELILLKLWFQALCGIVLGAIVVGIMVANTGGRMTVNQGTYLDQKDSRILAKRDMYIRTTTTRVRKPQNNSSSGGGGGRGGGGGGGSHGGGHF